MIRFAKRQSKNKNDCWIDAIALATENSYSNIENFFNPFKDPDGCLNSNYTKTYLEKFDYRYYENETDFFEAIQFIDSSRGVVFELEHEDGQHLVYVIDKIIYDNVDVLERITWFKNMKCIGFYAKIEGFYTKIIEK